MAHNNRLTRFTDAAEEPTRALTPIKGYETKDLVSLEEATAEVDPPISDVDSMVWLAKRDSRNPLDELTSDESASIRLYTSEWPETEQSVYTILNKKLRSSRRHELRPWFSYLKLFLTALYKLPSLKTTIWRGVSGNIDELYKEDFIWWGFSSCTATMKVAEKFVGRTGVRTLFMIDCINGKSIESHSQYKDEKEILLMPGTFLRVIDKCNPADDLHIIRLQEETPPYQLIAPPFTSASASALSVNTSSFQKLTISTSGASTTSVETKKTTFLSKPPTYKNPRLEQKINENKNKSTIFLQSSNWTDDDMEIVAYYLLRDNKTLTELHLYINQIGDKGAQALAEGLQKNTTLTILYLSNNQIGDKGAQALAEGLQKNTMRQHLPLTLLSLIFRSSSSLLFHSDTHRTPPQEQSDRRKRCTSIG